MQVPAVPDAEEEVKGEGAAGPPSTTGTKETEGRSLMDRARALPDAAGGFSSSADTQKEEEGCSLLGDVPAPENHTEPSAQRGAGDSAEAASLLRKVRVLLGSACELLLSCVKWRPGCIPHFPLATSGSCCLPSSRRSWLCLLTLCVPAGREGETTNDMSQLRHCSAAPCSC